MVRACISVGANLGDAVASVRQALRDVCALPNSQGLRASSLYRTAPIDATGPDFINAVVLLETELSPLSLLRALQSLERQAGRERPYHHAPRTLDLDLITYDDIEMSTPELTLPHPRWTGRAFVVVPMAEVCPELVPAHLLEKVRDQPVQRLPDQS